MVMSLGTSTKLRYSAPGPVSTWMGDRLRAGKPSWYVTATQVDSAFYPPWDGKMSAFGLSNIINGNGGYGLLVTYIGGSVAQAGWLGPKVGSHLAPFLYSSREPSELGNGSAVTTAL